MIRLFANFVRRIPSFIWTVFSIVLLLVTYFDNVSISMYYSPHDIPAVYAIRFIAQYSLAIGLFVFSIRLGFARGWRFTFTIRDLLWLTVVVALAVGWWLEHCSWVKFANDPLIEQSRANVRHIYNDLNPDGTPKEVK